jgi:hypothetical protein
VENTKPRISLLMSERHNWRELWLCVGQGTEGYGGCPKEAFIDWRLEQNLRSIKVLEDARALG